MTKRPEFGRESFQLLQPKSTEKILGTIYSWCLYLCIKENARTLIAKTHREDPSPAIYFSQILLQRSLRQMNLPHLFNILNLVSTRVTPGTCTAAGNERKATFQDFACPLTESWGLSVHFTACPGPSGHHSPQVLLGHLHICACSWQQLSHLLCIWLFPWVF